MPEVRFVRVRVAIPFVSVTVARAVTPFLNVTVPVGRFGPVEVTVALRVTD